MRAFLRAGGLSKEEVRRRPIIGICSSFSELNPCNMGLRDLAESVRQGVTAAGAVSLLGLERGEMLFVASHLSDLEAAAGCGLRTCYVSRPLEYGVGVVVEQAAAEGQFDLMVGDLLELATVMESKALQYI